MINITKNNIAEFIKVPGSEFRFNYEGNNIIIELFSDNTDSKDDMIIKTTSKSWFKEEKIKGPFQPIAQLMERLSSASEISLENQTITFKFINIKKSNDKDINKFRELLLNFAKEADKNLSPSIDFLI